MHDMSILKFVNAQQKLSTTTKHMGKSSYDQRNYFISRLTCSVYTPLFYKSLRMAPQYRYT